MAHIFIPRLLLWRMFSFHAFGEYFSKVGEKVKQFHAFSLYAYFHSAPSPRTHIFIPRLLLRRIFSFRAFSYGAHFHSALSPYTPIFYCLKEEISFYLQAFPAILWRGEAYIWMQEGVRSNDVASDRKWLSFLGGGWFLPDWLSRHTLVGGCVWMQEGRSDVASARQLGGDGGGGVDFSFFLSFIL